MHSQSWLDADSLRLVLKKLDPASLAITACVCRKLRQLASEEGLWEQYCRAKWKHPNIITYVDGSTGQEGSKDVDHPSDKHPSAAGSSWKGLYNSQNRWRQPRLATVELTHQCTVTNSLFVCGADDISMQGSPSEDVIALTSSHWDFTVFEFDDAYMEILRPYSPEGADQAAAYKLTDIATSVLPMGNATFATGTRTGQIQIHHLRDDQLDLLAQNSAPESQGCQVADMHFNRGKGCIYALHDSSELGVACRNYLRCYDVTRNASIGAPAHELFQDYELTAYCPSPHDCGGSQLIAGAVHTGCCRICRADRMLTMCYHKSHAHVAAICMFDLRSSISMVQRHTIHHRTLYPAMQSAREHYVFTSHAGTPLCAWDIRNMSTFVWEEERLGHYSERPEVYSDLPLGNKTPHLWSEHQGLCLATDEDTLIGRADSGMIWAWDLSATLGWQTPAAEQQLGSWLRQYSDEVPCEPEFKDWPTPLGVWNVGISSNPALVLRNGRQAVLVGACSDESDPNGEEVSLEEVTLDDRICLTSFA